MQSGQKNDGLINNFFPYAFFSNPIQGKGKFKIKELDFEVKFFKKKLSWPSILKILRKK
jgi:hypothetical protein